MPRVRVLSFLVCTLFLVLSLSKSSIGAQSSNLHRFAPILAFEPNVGQINGKSRYVSRSAEGTLFLNPDGLSVALNGSESTSTWQMKLAGKSRPAEIVGENATGGVSNYYRTGDRRNWFEGIPQYAQVRYRRIYSGIDLVFHGRGGHLEYDFEVAPQARVRDIQLEFSGAQSLSLDPDGTLVMKVADQQIRFVAPVAYQLSGDSKDILAVHFRLNGSHQVSFDVENYDHHKLLIIDPVVEYTYVLGLLNTTDVTAMAVNASGEVFLTGDTFDLNFPTSGTPTTVFTAFYIVRLNASGTGILYSTMLDAGGGLSIAIDNANNANNAYVGGVATTSAFPTTSQNLGTCGQTCNTGFAAKFDPSGKLVYSTLLGTWGVMPRAIAVAGNGEVLLAGDPGGKLQTNNAYHATCSSGCTGPFLARLNATGTDWDFATTFGAGGGTAKGLAIDSNGNIYVAGMGSVPTANALENSGNFFISEFSSDGQQLLASTYFGSAYGNTGPSLAGLVVASDGSVYIAGSTDQPDFPFTFNAQRLPRTQVGYGGTFLNMFLAGLTPGLAGVKFSTYLGQGQVTGLAIGPGDHISVAGSFNWEPISLKDAVVSDLITGAFVMTFDSTGQLTQSTQYGGKAKSEIPSGIAIDDTSAVYIAGIPGSTFDVSVGDLVDPVNVGTGTAYSNQGYMGLTAHIVGYTVFVAKISTNSRPQISLSYRQPYLVLRDASSVDLNLSSVMWAGAPLSTGDCGTTVPAGSSCFLTIPQPQVSQITITSNATPTTQIYAPSNVIGGSITFDLQPGKLYFPPQQIGTASPPQTFKIWNVQSTSQAISSIYTNGSLLQTNDCPASLAPGAYCTVTVVAAPSPNSSGGDLVNIVGTGGTLQLPAVIAAKPSSPLSLSSSFLAFGDTSVGKSSLVRSVNIHNAGINSLAAPIVAVQGDSAFSIVGTSCLSSLTPHQECAVAIHYTPVGNGHSSGTLNVTSGNSISQVQLGANGLIPSAVAISPLQLNLYTVVIGRQTVGQTVTLTNTGLNPITVNGVHFDLPDYAETDTCAKPIVPAGTCTITVTATPTVLGDRSTIMTVTFNSALTQSLAISLTSVFPLALDSSVTFSAPTLVSSYSTPQYLSIANNNGGPVNYTMIVTGDFAIQNSCGNPMPGFDGCSIPVIFHPQKAGPAQGMITVSVPGVTPVYQIPLTATAFDVALTPSRPARPGRGGNSSATSSQPIAAANPTTLPRPNGMRSSPLPRQARGRVKHVRRRSNARK